MLSRTFMEEPGISSGEPGYEYCLLKSLFIKVVWEKKWHSVLKVDNIHRIGKHAANGRPFFGEHVP